MVFGLHYTNRVNFHKKEVMALVLKNVYVLVFRNRFKKKTKLKYNDFFCILIEAFFCVLSISIFNCFSPSPSYIEIKVEKSKIIYENIIEINTFFF